MVRFPVLKRLQVADYQLFPGASNAGLDHRFDNGVHIIAGINGIGKTTLLNIIYRVLLGPVDGLKDDESEPGSSPHRLVPWRDSSYFRLRVADQAQSAAATVAINFGNDEIQLTRSLKDLSIIRLTVGEREETPTQEPI